MSYSKSIAWSGMIAIVPFLTLLASLTASLMPRLVEGGRPSAAANTLDGVLHGVLPDAVAGMLQQQLAWLQSQPPRTLLSVSALLSLWTAASAFTAVIRAVNHIYGAHETRGFWRRRLVGTVLVTVQMALAAISVVAILGWTKIQHALHLHGSQITIGSALDWLVVCAATFTTFAIVFRYAVAPESRNGRWVPGTIFGTVSFLTLTYGFRLYVEFFAHYQTLYGPVFGGVLVLMVWIWLMSFVVLIAAELNRRSTSLGSAARGRKSIIRRRVK